MRGEMRRGARKQPSRRARGRHGSSSSGSGRGAPDQPTTVHGVPMGGPLPPLGSGSSNAQERLGVITRTILRMKPPRYRWPAHTTHAKPIDYTKGVRNVKILRYQNPFDHAVEPGVGDYRFHNRFQMEWYSSVIMTKKRATTEMKWIDWSHLSNLEIEIIDNVESECERKELTPIMGFQQHWNEEVVAQFYATLWIDEEDNSMNFMLEGNRFKVTYEQFASFMGCGDREVIDRYKLHDENVLGDMEMVYMYDSRFGKVDYGTTKGLIPFYKFMNQLFRCTLSPKDGDSHNISNMAKNLLDRMNPNKGIFSVFDFIWHEIIHCSYSPKNNCRYAPYIFHMIQKVTDLEIITDRAHNAYKPYKKTVMNFIAEVEPSPAPQGQGPSSSAPSSSHMATLPRAKSKASKPKSGFSFIARGLQALTNICKKNSVDIYESNKRFDHELWKVEKRQKEMMAHANLPHSPLREPFDFGPPPVFDTPWDFAPSSSRGGYGGDEEEHDLGGRERNEDVDTEEDEYQEEGDDNDEETE